MKRRASQHGKVRSSLGDGVVSRGDFRSCGEDVVIEPGVRVFNPENVSLGARVYIGHDVIINGYHDGFVEIGDDSWVGPGSYLHGAGILRIGASVGIGPGVVVLTSSHADTDCSLPVLAEPMDFRPVTVSYGADLGARCVVLPGVHVGERAVVGAGAVVTSDVADGTVCAGVPARDLRPRRPPSPPHP